MTDIPSHPLSHSYAVVDVFNDTAFKGNAVAVVFDADHLSDAEMLSFTRWTNLSEAVFVLTATDPLADYRLRIFSSLHELDFAGHPTLGACHAWLEKTGHQALRDYVQQCGVGLVTLRRSVEGLAFRAPPLIRSGLIDASLLERVSSGLRLQAVGAHLVTAQWVDNGAGWLAVMIDDRDKLLALKPDFAQLDGLAIGVLAPWRSPPCDGEVDFELRAFIAGDSLPEDPATGSLAAGIAQWFAQTGQAPSSYTFSQGTALDRPCRIRVSTMADGIWIGGATKTLIRGQVQFPGSVATRG